MSDEISSENDSLDMSAVDTNSTEKPSPGKSPAAESKLLYNKAPIKAKEVKDSDSETSSDDEECELEDNGESEV